MRDSERPNAVRVNGFNCLACGQYLDGVFDVSGGPPRGPVDGDFSVCRRCNGVAVFVVSPLGYALRPLTDDEAEEYYELVEVAEFIAGERLPRPLSANRRLPKQTGE